MAARAAKGRRRAVIRAATASVEAPGFAARKVAADILGNVIRRRRPLDEQLRDVATQPDFARLSERDRALVRALTAKVLRRLGSGRHLLRHLVDRGLPDHAPGVELALLIGMAQILWLDVPDHAAVDLSVRLVRSDRRAASYAGLVNAILRRTIREGSQYLASTDAVALDTPSWLMDRWVHNYGTETARRIAAAHSQEPAIDFTIKKKRGEPQGWAEKLGGRVLPTGSVRAVVHGPTTQLAGYAEGAWWVQDAAAGLPARLMGDLQGRVVADVCAAPGGKTMQLAAAGARVVAIDRSADRVARLRENLRRVGLAAELVTGDVLEWEKGSFDAVLLDAPCSATGTIRRHPDIPWIKREADIPALALIQRHLLAKAADLVKPGGTLIYCVCSLEPEEGKDVVGDLLRQKPQLRRRPVTPGEAHIPPRWLTAEGDLRTLPCHLPDRDPAMAGLDGFYAARLERIVF